MTILLCTGTVLLQSPALTLGMLAEGDSGRIIWGRTSLSQFPRVVQGHLAADIGLTPDSLSQNSPGQ